MAPADDYRCLAPAAYTGEPLDLYAVPRPSVPGRPWVLANFVAGIDGAVAVDGRVGPLTSPADQRVFHHLRSVADLVLVGAGTVRAERYGPARVSEEQRTARTARGQAPVPPMAVVSTSLDLDWTMRFFTAAEVAPLIVTSAASDPDARRIAEQHAEVLVVGDDAVDLRRLLEVLDGRGLGTVLCEGGPALLAELLALGLLDELCLTVSPMTGGDPLRLVRGDVPQQPTAFALAHVLAHDHELYLRYLTVRGDADGA